MKYGIRENRCEGWFEAVAIPSEGKEDRSPHFDTYKEACDAVYIHRRTGKWTRKESTREWRIKEGIKGFKGRRMKNGYPYVQDLRERTKINDITAKERNRLARKVFSKK